MIRIIRPPDFLWPKAQLPKRPTPRADELRVIDWSPLARRPHRVVRFHGRIGVAYRLGEFDR